MGKQKSFEQEHENGDEEDEALSLSDLPNNQETESPVLGRAEEVKAEEFDFCSRGGSMKESEMCAADELFFRGQILPLGRNSVSSDGGAAVCGGGIRSNSSRCNSMDRCYSVGGYTTASSRSSSTRSHQSSSSGGGGSGRNHRTRNQFQYSQPSPTPHIIRSSKLSHGLTSNSYNSRNSTLWSLFRVGLVTMPEIGSNNIKIRSRENSTRSKKDQINVTKKLKQRFLDKNLVFFDSCKCSADSVETIPLRSNKGQEQKKNSDKEQVTTSGKQTISRIRTFEWLKQLSLLEGEDSTCLNN